MSQDAESGRRAVEFGRSVAVRVAEILGAKLVKEGSSNLVVVDGQKAVVKSAHKANPFIGITRSMLPSLDAAYAVLEIEKGGNRFEVFRVDREFLRTRRKEPGAASRHGQWFYTASDIRKLGSKIATFDLGEERRYWVTTQWPHKVDTDPNAPRDGVYLPDGREQAGADLRPGDLVAVYEAKDGRPIVREDVSGKREVIKTHTGRQGIVALLRVTSRLCKDDESEPQKYTDGSEIWWRWYAEAEPYSASGFVPREELNRILGYALGNPLKGFGDLHSGLKQVDRGVFERIETSFRENGAVPELKTAIRKTKYVPRGGGGEGEAHLLIKNAIAEDPTGVLGEPGLRTIGKEYRFPTGDEADILLEDAAGRVIGLEVEPAVGDNDLPGILQAIKYRYMGALMLNKRFLDSRSFLVAGAISPLARKICEAYQVECFVVDPATLKRESEKS